MGDIKKAKKLLLTLSPANEKRFFLDSLHDDIAKALLAGNSIRKIYEKLKEAEFTGSLMMLSAWIKVNNLKKESVSLLPVNKQEQGKAIKPSVKKEELRADFKDKRDLYDNDEI